MISGLLGQFIDTIAIFTIVLLNAAIGFYQEWNAVKSITALKKMTTPHANVKRVGTIHHIPSSQIVTGDILVLEAGDIVAGDARLLKTSSLRCDESTLTGESVSVSKNTIPLEKKEIPLGDRTNMVFMGTHVATGTGEAVVVATGMKTELGRISELLDPSGNQNKTPLQLKLSSLGKTLVWATLGIVALLFGLGLLRGTNLRELFMTSVSLAVAAVPEGLPAVVTVALSVGVLRMSRRRALVRKLVAVETLGSTSVICTDKTGTLTVGEMTVRQFHIAGQNYNLTGEGYDPRGEVQWEGQKVREPHLTPLLDLSTLLFGCNQSHLLEENGVWKIVGDPTEGALLVAAQKAGGDRQKIEKEIPKVHEYPFDSDRKRSSVLRQMPEGKQRLFVLGAPDSLLDLSTHLYTPEGIRPITESDRELLRSQISHMSQKALRVLGSAWRDLDPASSSNLSTTELEQDLVFVALSGMADPPRPEAKTAIQKCQHAGIRVVMITGDHPETAEAIAKEIGLLTSDESTRSGLQLDSLSDEELRAHVPQINVFARVTAEHKLRIIHALKANGEVVAMTGDGVNDAPAIQGADIGIAMGKGTEVTKQAADMIITDDRFDTIVTAVEEGRGIYSNIRKTLQYLLAGSTGELLLMAFCVIIGLPTPLLPIHLLWINLVTDGLPALCLATDPIDPDIMNRPPRPRSERITNSKFLWIMGLTGFLTAAVTFAVYVVTLRSSSPEVARSYAFTVLVFAEILRAFGARSEIKPVWRISLFSNPRLILVVAFSLGIQIWSHHNQILGHFLKTTSIPFTDSLWLLAWGCIPLVVLEIVKVIRNRAKPDKIAWAST